MIKISQKIILGIVASIMFIVPMLGIPHALAASTTGIMIPLYSYPTSTTWNNVIAAKNAHPSVPFVVIINPNSGPGTSQNQAFVTGIQKLKDAGIIVLGYIPTKYAVRSSATVMHDIDLYKSWYAVDGVKFDEMTNTVGYETYYSNLSDYAKSIGLAMTVGNPGADVPPSYIGIVDNLTIFENGFLPTLSYLGGWHTNYDKSNFSSESYAIPTLDQTYVSSASQYLGYIYLTDDNLPNPWDTTSSYLNTLAATLDVEPAPTPVASSTVVSSNINPSVVGQTVTFTATVTGSGGTPTGTVTFRDGLNNIATGTLSSGTVTFITSSLSVGTHSITAVYSGDSNFDPSTSPAITQTVNKGGTTTTVSSNANPSDSGQSVTFTATVSPLSPASGTRTGTVTFFDGVTILGTGTLSANTATLSTSTLGAGTHSITATYSGDSNFNSSASSAITQTVNSPAPGVSSTAISSSLNPSVFGQSITFTATVSGSGGTPTGTVTFRDGVTILGTDTLSSGIATFAISSLGVGTHSITASYGGDANFDTSASISLTQTVNKIGTSTSISSSLNPSTEGQSVTFTATVTESGGTPTGTVTFRDGVTILGTGTLSSNTATLSTTTLAAGTHSITAVYSGDSFFNTSTSPTLSQTVNSPAPVASSTVVSSNINPSVVGQIVTFTATVTGSGGTPTGTVTFRDGLNNIGSGTLASGVASFTSTLATGTHGITAVYSGDSNFDPSTSPAMTQTVNKGGTTTTISSNANPSDSGQSVTFTATVSPISPASGTRTGTVTFFDGATILGTGTISANTASITTSSLSPGGHSITATYSGDSNFNPSTSPVLTQTVNNASQVDSTTTVSSNRNPAKWHQSVTFTATVTGSGGTPTGTVTFIDSGTSLGTRTLVDGTASFTTASLAAGTHSITAVYSGDSNFNPSSSPTLTQTIYKGGSSTLGLTKQS